MRGCRRASRLTERWRRVIEQNGRYIVSWKISSLDCAQRKMFAQFAPSWPTWYIDYRTRGRAAVQSMNFKSASSSSLRLFPSRLTLLSVEGGEEETEERNVTPSASALPILLDISRESKLRFPSFRGKVNRSPGDPFASFASRSLGKKHPREGARRQSPRASFVSHLGTADNQAATIPLQRTIGI